MADILDRLEAALADRYQIELELGSGGMATVYLARDLKHDRKVAVKVFRPELAAALGTERFFREIKITANLSHPHILPLLDSGEAEGFLYYVMPVIEGESLRDRLNRDKQLPVDEALKITSQVASALSYAHAHDIVHRDIKPENILFQAGEVVVADFGIALAVDSAGGTRLTETGFSLGTPAYMSPEQAAGEHQIDGRSDVYALGCVLYEMLAGEPPFTAPTTHGLIAKKLSEATPRISVVRETVPYAVEHAVSTALAKVPVDRFATALQFAEALSGERVSVVPPREPAKRRVARRIALFGAVAVLVTAGAVVLGRSLSPGSDASRHPRTAIAVLPFQNLSAEGPHAYFAGGLHGELLTQLAKVAALTVKGRTSVMGYAHTTKPLSEIADELGVGSVVDAGVQVLGDRLRVNVRLIEVETGENVWAERYDGTLDDAFAIQSDLAQQVVAQVGAVLSGSERQALAEAPTANAEAYQLYLQGYEYFRRPGYLRENLESAQQLLERALALDPEFALAYADLSDVHSEMHWSRYDPSPERVAQQREAAEAALRLAPELPRAHHVMGVWHYRGERDYARALIEYDLAARGMPNNPYIWFDIGAVHRRLGNFDEALAAFEKAVELDPRNADLLFDLGGYTYGILRRYAEEVRAYDRALSLAPGLHGVAITKGWAYARWQGQLDTLRSALNRMPTGAAVGQLGSRAASHVQLLFWERQADSLLNRLHAERTGVFQGDLFFLPSPLYAAWAHRLLGDGPAARAAFDSALVLVDSALTELPDDWRVHVARGLVLAGLDRREGALREADWLQESVVHRLDAWQGRWLAEERALVLAQAGDADAAIDELDRLLAQPSWVSVPELHLNPLWDPIREHPRFQALLERYEN